jgi:rod shape determining protein RodA
MNIGLMPVAGLSLPFLSYGGSFLVVSMSGLGLAQSIWKRRRKNELPAFLN